MPYNPSPAWASTTPEQRAAHLFACFYPWRAREICAEEGITNEQMARGTRMREIELSVHRSMCARFGDPSYGSWPEYAADERSKLLSGILAEEENKDLL
jgi:hypothetical protein